MTGAASDVPPMRYSSYLSEPSGNVCDWPTRKPVFGSATAEMSGTVRIFCEPPLARASEFGTTPLW